MLGGSASGSIKEYDALPVTATESLNYSLLLVLRGDCARITDSLTLRWPRNFKSQDATCKIPLNAKLCPDWRPRLVNFVEPTFQRTASDITVYKLGLCLFVILVLLQRGRPQPE